MIQFNYGIELMVDMIYYDMRNCRWIKMKTSNNVLHWINTLFCFVNLCSMTDHCRLRDNLGSLDINLGVISWLLSPRECCKIRVCSGIILGYFTQKQKNILTSFMSPMSCSENLTLTLVYSASLEILVSDTYRLLNIRFRPGPKF